MRKKEERIWEKVIIYTNLPENMENSPKYVKKIGIAYKTITSFLLPKRVLQAKDIPEIYFI